MEFNALLTLNGFDLHDVAVMLHTPVLAQEKNALMALVDDYPDLFEAYQDNHPPRPEATLKRRKYAASLVVGTNSEAYFVGMYRIAGWRDLCALELDADPRRRAVIERYRGGSFSPPPPDWRDFAVTTDELRLLPRDWAARLAGWRGVYLITDERDGSRYVGSAYGAENLLGRWRAHVAKDKGVTVELGQRDPGSFRFSILQLLLHDAEASEVQALEANWKTRLHTRTWGLNKN